VRGGLSISQGTNSVTLPLRKREDNREYKAVPKVKRYPSTRLPLLIIIFSEKAGFFQFFVVIILRCSKIKKDLFFLLTGGNSIK